MSVRRVVITGMGAVSPFGPGVGALFEALRQEKSAVTRVPGLDVIEELGPRIAGLVPQEGLSESIPRKFRRSMSRMSVYAFLAAQEAIAMGQVDEERIQGGRSGVIVGSTLGSVDALEELFSKYMDAHRIEQIKSTLFFRIMGHSVASNIAQALGMTGRIFAPSAACSTGCQAIGLGYETIAMGRQDMMLCGGADEFHPLTAATFDIMQAASTGYNDTPSATPRPFDTHRDGVVCAEGAGVLLLESLESAQVRNATILGEVMGFSCMADPSSIANPDPGPIRLCMEDALRDARIAPEDVGYINAHATGTVQGDIAESRAIAHLFGKNTPVSSLKGHLGHTMAASGALELIACIRMIESGFIIATRNLAEPDPECACIQHARHGSALRSRTIVKNNFALGGVNCSIVIRGFHE